MKQIEHLVQLDQDRLEDHAQTLRDKLKLISSQRRIPGLTLWEYNHDLFTLEKAKYKTVDIMTTGGAKSTVLMKENCYYFQALNLENAIKRLVKAGLIMVRTQ